MYRVDISKALNKMYPDPVLKMCTDACWCLNRVCKRLQPNVCMRTHVHSLLNRQSYSQTIKIPCFAAHKGTCRCCRIPAVSVL